MFLLCAREICVCVWHWWQHGLPLSLAVCWFYVACMSGQCVKLGRMEYESALIMFVCTLVMLHCFTIPWCSFKCGHWAFWSAITEQRGCLHSPSEERTLIFMSAVSHSGLTDVAPLKPGVGQDIALHASPAARNFILVLISVFPKKSWTPSNI